MKKALPIIFMIALIAAAVAVSGCTSGGTDNSDKTITITDAAGRTVVIPDNPQKIAVSGSGSSRYFAWLQVTDRMVAVDYQDSSLLKNSAEARPYMMANPQIKELTVLGAAKAVVDPEKLMSANPDVLFMAGVSDTAIQTANELTEKTGIPVVLFYVGDYVTSAEKVSKSIRMIGSILHADKRTEEVLKYFEDVRTDLESRVTGISESGKPTVYVAGVAYNGAHGMTGTYALYYPFEVLNADNVASDVPNPNTLGYVEASKEQILAWNPDIIFVDLGTQTAAGGGAIVEMQTDPSYSELTAVKTGEVYAINPHTSMNTNHETSMANAYYIGKILYPEQFKDIDPAKKADEIYTFIDGAPVYEQLKANMRGLSYTKLEI